MPYSERGCSEQYPGTHTLLSESIAGDGVALVELDSIVRGCDAKARTWLAHFAHKHCLTAVSDVLHRAGLSERPSQEVVIFWGTLAYDESARAWIRLIEEGDDLASTELLNISTKIASSVIARARGSRNRDDAEDLAQQVCTEFIRMLREGKFDFDKAGRYAGLIKIIALRLCSKELRREKRIRGALPSFREHAMRLRTMLDEIGHELELEHDCVREEFDAATEDDRCIYLMRAQGLTYSQIAKVMKLPVSQVTQRCVTFRGRLAKRMRRTQE